MGERVKETKMKSLILALFSVLVLVGAVSTTKVTKFEIKDGVHYNARAFNWDQEKWHEVEIEFEDEEATIYFNDDFHEPRVLNLLYAWKEKDSKIELIDLDRDIFWDVEIGVVRRS